MAAPHSRVHICDPDNPDQIAKVNPDGTIAMSGGGGGSGGDASAENQLTQIEKLTDIELLQQSVETLQNTILLFASMLNANSPRIDAAGRMAAIVETGTVSISGALTTLNNLTTLANQTNAGGFPLAYSMQDVPLHIYNNIIVS